MAKVKLLKKEKYGIVEMDSPSNLNAFDEELLDDLIAVLDECEADGDMKVVVIRGAGKAFSSGGDIGAMKKALDTDIMDFFGPVIDKVGKAALRIRKLSKPVVASVHGAAAGAGFNLALACDFRIAADNAKFTQAFVRIALIPDMGGIYFLSSMLGAARATELAMCGTVLRAGECRELGLVNRTVPADELEKETEAFVSELTEGPSLSYKHMKDLINSVNYPNMEEILGKECVYQAECAKTADFAEGITTFAGKRKPVFK